MDKVISANNYWQQFGEKYPDVEPFRSFISADPILAKICEFAATPNIFLTIETDYPFDEKLAELSTITKEDIAHLSDLNIRTGYNRDKEEVSDWLGLLDNLFGLVSTTIRYYGNGKHQLNMDDSLIREVTIQRFRKYFSVCETGVSEDKKGQRYNWQRIGWFLPDARLFKREMPGFPPQVICELQFFLKPTKERVLRIKKKFGIGSIENYLQFRLMTDEICYGGFDPRLDQGPSKLESTNYLARFLYKGKQLKGKEFAEFNYPIRKRHAGVINTAVGKGVVGPTRREKIGFIEEGLLEAFGRFDKNNGAPRSFLDKSIWGLGKDFDGKFESTVDYDQEVFPYDLYRDEEGELDTTPMPRKKSDIEKSGGNIEDLKSRYHPKTETKDSHKMDPEEAFDKACQLVMVESDETNRRIIEILIKDEGWKKTNSINYSAIARALGTYDVDIKRRCKEILRKIRKEYKRLLSE